MGNRIMEYNVKTNEIREYLPDAGQCTISDDGRIVSYFRNHAKRIIRNSRKLIPTTFALIYFNQS